MPPLPALARADQDLLELFASEIAVAIRNAELYERVEAQNAQLLELERRRTIPARSQPQPADAA
jgi:GAF domain-containing protein